MITILATALINSKELWKIALAALVGGTGVVIVFGLLLLGISRARTAKTARTRYGLYTLSGVCGLFVIAVATIGVYAMTQKPGSGRPKPEASAAGLTSGAAVASVPERGSRPQPR
jgi:hypothetical protein